MEKLNLPQINTNIRKNSGKLEIFDIIRKKYIVLTPEEWVRQHLIHYLITELNYPGALMRVESGVKYNKLSKRTDLLVYDRDSSPFLLLECKSSSIKLDQRTLDQVAVYNTQIKSPYIGISNGLKHYCLAKTKDNTYNTLNSFPDFPID